VTGEGAAVVGEGSELLLVLVDGDVVAGAAVEGATVVDVTGRVALPLPVELQPVAAMPTASAARTAIAGFFIFLPLA
jgi:hypothetical protein